MSGLPGSNWNGHLPSTKLEREYVLAIDGCEDEDGNPLVGPGGFVADASGPEEVVRRPRQHNTGPKGVLEDAKRAAAQQRMARQASLVEQQELRRLDAGTASTGAWDRAVAAAEAEAAGEEEEEDEEDDAFRQYRLDRLKQLQLEAQKASRLPTFGQLVRITQDEYVDFIEAVDADTFVVVHLYEEYLPACVRLNFRLQALAKQYNHVKFGAIVASEAKETMTCESLPALVAYREGDYLESELNVDQTVGDDDLPVHAVVKVLQRMGVKLTAAPEAAAADAALRDRMRGLACDDDELAVGDGEDDARFSYE